MRLVYAELLKIRTAPWTSVTLFLALIAIVVLGASGIANDARDGFVDDPEADIIDMVGIATIFTLILGILVVTWDYRHGTITQTFLASPRRERVVAAKLATTVVLSALLLLVAMALALFVAKIWLGDQFSLTEENWEQARRIVAAGVLWGILGLGLGATLQTQVGALISALIWFLVVEFILVGLGSRIWNIGHYLPGQALSKFASVAEPEHLTRTEAGLLAVAYAIGLAALGTLSMLRRDVA
jgi:ABC-2 type transport system permease protein